MYLTKNLVLNGYSSIKKKSKEMFCSLHMSEICLFISFQVYITMSIFEDLPV